MVVGTSVHRVAFGGEPQGQATFGMANLRPDRAGLPFVVFISQKGGARHDVRVKVSRGPKVRPDEMSSYGLRPYGLTDGPGLSATEEALLQAWIDVNLDVLVAYRDGDIEYTMDAVDRLTAI